jgi:hypothetical protein
MHENPLSQKDVMLAKFRTNGQGELLQVKLIGDNKNNFAGKFARGAGNVLFIAASTPNNSSLAQRQDWWILKTTTNLE